MLRRVGAVALGLLIGGARVGFGQTIHGAVRDSASALPIPSAVVSLVDSAGHAAQRVLTDRQGRFALAGKRGFDRVQVLHIGHQPRTIRIPTSNADSVITLDIRMTTLLIALDTVRVRASGGETCPSRDDQVRALAIWEQARAGLLAALVARDGNAGQLVLLSYDRDLKFDNGVVIQQTVNYTSLHSDRPFIAPRTATDLVLLGYTARTQRGAMQFFGPDVDVLEDENFATSHCFRLVGPDLTHPGQIGIGFVPATARPGITDIAGILWLDAVTPQLRTVDYGYTNLVPVTSGSALGGRIGFTVLPNGVPVVERWVIRTSRAVTTPVGFRGKLPPTPTVDGKADGETGAELMSAEWSDSIQWHATLGRVSGRLTTRTAGTALTGVRVTLGGTEYAAVTDSSGAFVIDEVLPGRYAVSAADDSLASFGLVQSVGTPLVNVALGATATSTIEIRPAAAVLVDRCGSHPAMGATPLLIRVLHADGSAAPTDSVRVAVISQPSSKHEDARALPAPGTFIACGVASGNGDSLVVTVAGHATTTPITPRVGVLVDTTTVHLPRRPPPE